MAWLELKLAVDAGQIEGIESCLLDLGAQAVTYRAGDNTEVLEPAPGGMPLWRTAELTALFHENVDADRLRFKLTSGEFGHVDCTVHRLADQIWERAWMDHYQPMRFGRDLWIVPSFAKPPDERDAICLNLDPGLAFGTGTHATTALCLEYLEQHRPIQKSVIDYGCGSGILALAALKLGASQVCAVDYDPQALAATRENLLRNGIAPERLSLCDPESFVGEPADLVLANILSSTLIELAPALLKLVKRGGQIVLSGILAEQAESVSTAYGFSSADKKIQDGWVLLSSDL